MSADQPTVLVVEDEASQREVLRYNLEAEGFRVAAAGKCSDASGKRASWRERVLAIRTTRNTLRIDRITSELSQMRQAE